MHFPAAFELELPHGLCVGVQIPADVDPGAVLEASELDATERAHAASLHKLRRVSWVAGRVAMHRALGCLGVPAATILPDDRGAPVLPAGVAGSISHKRSLAVALVADRALGTLGVDVEEHRVRSLDIARRVLTPEEVERGVADRDVLLYFSVKEAVYKAIDPFLRRFVGFREVSIVPGDDGAVAVDLHVPCDPPLAVEGFVTRRGDTLLSSARARIA